MPYSYLLNASLRLHHLQALNRVRAIEQRLEAIEYIEGNHLQSLLSDAKGVKFQASKAYTLRSLDEAKAQLTKARKARVHFALSNNSKQGA